VTKVAAQDVHLSVRSAQHAARSDILRGAAVTIDCLRKLHPPAAPPAPAALPAGPAGPGGGWRLEIRDRIGVGPVEAALAYQDAVAVAVAVAAWRAAAAAAGLADRLGAHDVLRAARRAARAAAAAAAAAGA
jgi:hypothetical protein